MQSYSSVNQFMDNMFKHEHAVRQSITKLTKELNIYGFAYTIVNKLDRSYTALSSHAAIFEKYIAEGFLNESPYIFMPNSLPKYHLNNFQEDDLNDRLYHICEFMKIHGTNKIFVLKINKGTEYHFAAFYSPNDSINQVNTFIANIPLLRQFSNLFYKRFNKTLKLGLAPIQKLTTNHAGTDVKINTDLKVVSNHDGLPETLCEMPKNKMGILTKRELQIIIMYADGMTTHEIGKAYFISHKTVERHICNSKDKLGFNTKVQLYKYVSEIGFLSDVCDLA